ncbi:molybdopterin molybdotransferase MoeA [soil metagenome]
MLSVADATRAVLARVARLPDETVALDAARGRVLACAVRVERALPAFDNSAMDGYALRSSDAPGTLPVAGVIAAGEPRTEPVHAGTCVRIFNGAPLPADCDTVVIQENVTLAGDDVTVPASRVGENVRRAGEDFAIGDIAMTQGTRLGAWHIGVLAALGVVTVPVVRPPRVAIIATGDELVDVTTTPRPGQLVDSSAHALAAAIADAGGVATYLGIARDDLDALTQMLAQALDYDVVITTGGVSVGDRDYMHAAMKNAGVALELYKVAMRPGKPFSFGVAARGTPVFGLPGNPVSTLVAYELFVRPALLAMQGATVVERPRVPVHLATTQRKNEGRVYFLRARVVREGERLVARIHPKQGSAMLSALVDCNALVQIPAETSHIDAGATATAILFEAV